MIAMPTCSPAPAMPLTLGCQTDLSWKKARSASRLPEDSTSKKSSTSCSLAFLASIIMAGSSFQASRFVGRDRDAGHGAALVQRHVAVAALETPAARSLDVMVLEPPDVEPARFLRRLGRGVA